MTLTATRELLDDERLWIMGARIALHDGESSHHRKTEEGANEVSVRTSNHGLQLWALLPGGSNGDRGIWSVPEIGTEVLIACEDGDPEGDVFLVSAYGHSPSTMTTTQLILLINDVIEARSVGGTAKALAYKSDLDAVASKLNSLIGKYNTHIHPLSSGTSSATTSTETTVGASTGTQKFKAE